MEKYEAHVAYDLMRAALNVRQWRLYVAVEAKKIGHGGISTVARDAQTTRGTIRKGIAELEGGVGYVAGDRVRRRGGGRKRLSALDPTLVGDLEALVDPKGDPMSLLKWTTKSISHLHAALQAQGHTVARTTIRRLLRAHDYTLQANSKEYEGVGSPDRDAQFLHIKEVSAQCAAQGTPLISVDCKKKELLGTFKNHGQEWQPKGQTVAVNVYDFLSLADGKAIPYGVYDVLHNAGFVNVGQDHDTAAFAVESIRRWWQQHGQARYAQAQEILKGGNLYNLMENPQHPPGPTTRAFADQPKPAFHLELLWNPHSDQMVVTSRQKLSAEEQKKLAANEPPEFSRPTRDLIRTLTADGRYSRPQVGTAITELLTDVVGKVANLLHEIVPEKASDMVDSALNSMIDAQYTQRSYNVFNIGDGANQLPSQSATLSVPIRGDEYLKAMDIMRSVAARFATHVLLLREGRVLCGGAAPEVLTAARLSELYGVKMQPVTGWSPA